MLDKKTQEIARRFPIMDRLSEHLCESRFLQGLRIGWHCHLTWLTALAVEPVLTAGGRLFLSECNADTTQSDAVGHIRELGADVAMGSDSCRQVLNWSAQIISDTGLVLLSTYLSSVSDQAGHVFGACEITTSGITRLRALPHLPLPVININEGRLKNRIENFHGVAGEFMEALKRLTGRHWSGRKAAVIGYGRVGSGIACYLKKAGAHVTIVERDPVLRLAAHFDGFVSGELPALLGVSELVVTATGEPGLIGASEWQAAADGLYVFNAGHWADEVSPGLLYEMAISRRQCAEHLEEIQMAVPGGRKKVYLACGGSPANIVVSMGAPEPTLIHLATEILAIEYLARQFTGGTPLAAGEHLVADEIERQASLMALAALPATLSKFNG